MQILTSYAHGAIRAREFARLSNALQTEAHLLPQSAKSLEDQFKAGLSAIRIDDTGRIEAHCTLWPLIDNVYELGTAYTYPQYRGHGDMPMLYAHLFASNFAKDILLTTTNKHAVRAGEKVGVVPIFRTDLPTIAWRASCVCSASKTGGSPETCQIAYGEVKCASPCVFRVSPMTAVRMNLKRRPMPTFE